MAPSERAAIIAVDVQRDFCAGGALEVPGCLNILLTINQYLAHANERGMSIFASRDWHPAVTSHFNTHGGRWPPHCVQGSAGAAFVDGLKLPKRTLVITKGDDSERPGYSALDGHTDTGRRLSQDLRERHIQTLYVTGLATEFCVKHTTLDALELGLQVIVLTDAIAGINAHPGDIDRALKEMVRAGAELSTGLRIKAAK